MTEVRSETTPNPGRDQRPRTFAECVVLVTGAGRGMGRACAELAASLGAITIVNDVGISVDGAKLEDEPVADEVVAKIRADGGVAHASTHDLRSPQASRELISWVVERTGRLDALIHCAGVSVAVAAHEIDDDILANIVGGTLFTGLNIVYPAFRVMRGQGFGRIVLVSSGAAAWQTEQRSPYAAGKGGLVGLMNGLAMEGEPFGIGINSILPSARTRMSENPTSPAPEDVALAIVALADPAFAGTGYVYSAVGRTVCRVATTVTDAVSVDSVEAAVSALGDLQQAPPVAEPRTISAARPLREGKS